MLTSEQVRAARAMLRIDQSELAAKAEVSLETIKRIEQAKGPITALSTTLAKITGALEAAGVIFVAENGEGPGVRLRKGAQTTK